MKSIIVNLAISADEYQRLYQGSAQTVSALSVGGQRIRFPANILRPFVLHSGIYGTFQINFDDRNRFVSIDRLSPTPQR